MKAHNGLLYEHGARYINVTKYRIARYCKMLNSAVISLKYACKNAFMSACVCILMCMYYFVGYLLVLRL